MLQDKLLILSTAQAVTASAAGNGRGADSIIDTGADGLDLEGNIIRSDKAEGMVLCANFLVTTGFTGAATITFSVRHGAASGTLTDVVSSMAIPSSRLKAGFLLKLYIPVYSDKPLERYINVYYTVASGPAAGGVIDGWIDMAG
jgi:hypothetical protein